MKLFLKILKFTGILVVTVSILLTAASYLLQDRVAGIILNSFNKNLSTKLDIGSFRLSFLSKFPKASLELRNVLVHSSRDFHANEFTGINTDTLISARSVSVEFRITDIINGIYNIERISAKSGRANFYTDTTGHVNYKVSVYSQHSDNDTLTINLERINLTDIKTYYNNLSARLIMNGIIKNGKIKSRISGDKIDIIAAAAIDIDHFRLFNTTIPKTVSAGLNVILQSSESGILFKKSSLSIENFQIELDGFVATDNTLDLNVTGKNLDLAKIRNYLPENYRNLASVYKPSGLFNAECKIKGPLTRTKNPHVEINGQLTNGTVTWVKPGKTINNISFKGNLSNGSKNQFSTSSASFNDVKFKLGSAEYVGSVSISDFLKPKTGLVLKGKVFPGEVKEFFAIQNISTADGSVDVDLKLITNFWPKNTITTNDIIGLKPEGSLSFNSLSIGFHNDQLLFKNVNGNLFVSAQYRAENLRFNYKEQKIKVDGTFNNLPEWLAGKPVQLTAVADISFDRFIPEAFLKTSSPSGQNISEKRAVNLPEDISLDLNIKIDSLRYKTFMASTIAGTLNYTPHLLTFKSLNMNSLDGSISGSGYVFQSSTKSMTAKGSFNLSGLNVNKAFITFHNFGQEFIKAGNLSGKLSGSLSVLIPMDSLFKTDIKSVTAEGRYTLLNGALINFEPVKHLSSYIELSELENIHFEKLENDFFIRNNFFYLPQMDVRSSAADLSVNGSHSFDNNYEYHVKVLLSEILSKKRKEKKRQVTEFGIVEDDGLGRTSMLLKVTGKGEDIRVGYDLKAAGSEVKNNIKTERQTLKTILNQEYGWYKSDSTTNQKPVKKTSRFRITWDETDSTKIKKDP